MQSRIVIVVLAALGGALACQSGAGDEREEAAPASARSEARPMYLVPSGEPGPVAALAAAARAADVEFEENAFPPTLPSDVAHAGAWLKRDCMLCHEADRGSAAGRRSGSGAPAVRHSGMPRRLLAVHCRTCHVPVSPLAPDDGQVEFARNAFPPTLPANASHENAWLRDDCLTCHQNGVDQAPRVIHDGMPPILLRVRCRSCHVPR